MLHAMIMAGGGGTRFWPRSRQIRPKQFLRFTGERTLLQGTVDRIAAQVPPERTWVLTSAQHRAEAVEQLKGMVPAEQIVGEPMGRDTAACIGLGAALVARVERDATIMVMPADHLIEPEQEFRRAAHAAEQFAGDYPDKLLTFGIRPTFPSTGYGYIRRGETVATRQQIPLAKVLEFKEKPAAADAETFVATGDYFWNSGIFVWRPAAILGELKARKPQLHAAVARIAAAWDSASGSEVFHSEYERAEKISIDYAVMQDAAKAGKVLVMTRPKVGRCRLVARARAANPGPEGTLFRDFTRGSIPALRDRRRLRTLIGTLGAPIQEGTPRSSPLQGRGRCEEARGQDQADGMGLL